MATKCSCTTKDGSVVVGAIFFIASIAAEITTVLEFEGGYGSYRFSTGMCMTQMMLILVGMFSAAMAVGARLGNPTLMFPWLAVQLATILAIPIIVISILIGAWFDLQMIGAATAIIVVKSLSWAVVYHHYNRLISPKTTKTFSEKPLGKEYKDIVTYHRFNNDNTA